MGSIRRPPSRRSRARLGLALAGGLIAAIAAASIGPGIAPSAPSAPGVGAGIPFGPGPLGSLPAAGSARPVAANAILGSQGCRGEGVPDAYCGHYFVGALVTDPLPLFFCAVYCVSPPTLPSVVATMTIPNATPMPGDAWAAVVSIFDNAPLPSYDQIGFAPMYGVGWVPVYSYSTACGESRGIHSAYASSVVLLPGTSYTFSLTALGGGVILFAVTDARTGAPIWSSSHATGGDGFLAMPYLTCWNNLGLYASYTIGEEVYASEVQAYPSYPIVIQNATLPPPMLWAFSFGWGSIVDSAPPGYLGTTVDQGTIVLENPGTPPGYV
ncbi:MAG: hypothetical protein QXG65_06055 [Thermoplasmata archaeon]